MRLTLFDVLFLLALAGGAAWGFYRGVLRQSVNTALIYISVVAATVGYRGLSRLLRGTGQPAPATDMLAFLILLGVLNLLLFLMARELIGEFNAERMHIASNVFGMVCGFLNAAIYCSVLLVVLRSSTAGDPWIGYENFRLFFRDQTANSWMAFIFRPFMYVLLAIVKPWMFGYDLPPLLMNAL